MKLEDLENLPALIRPVLKAKTEHLPAHAWNNPEISELEDLHGLRRFAFRTGPHKLTTILINSDYGLVHVDTETER